MKTWNLSYGQQANEASEGVGSKIVIVIDPLLKFIVCDPCVKLLKWTHVEAIMQKKTKQTKWLKLHCITHNPKAGPTDQSHLSLCNHSSDPMVGMLMRT